MQRRMRSNLLAIFLVGSGAVIPIRAVQGMQDCPSNPKDNYLIIELQAREKEQLLEHKVQIEQEAQLESVSFDIQSDIEYEEDNYQITKLGVDEPILTQLLTVFVGQMYGISETEDIDNLTVAMYDVASFEPGKEGNYQFCFPILQDADCTLYQNSDEGVRESTLHAELQKEQGWQLSYMSKSNHWLVLQITFPKEEKKDTSYFKEKSRVQKDKSDDKESTKENQTKEKNETNSPTETIHNHEWKSVTRNIHHDAIYQQIWKEDVAAYDELVVIKEPWTEECLVEEAWDEPVYSDMDICSVCGYVYPIGAGIEEYSYHQFIDPGDGGGWYTQKVQTESIHHDAIYQSVLHDAETKTIHHEAQGHYEDILVEEAWDESVVTGYVCEECGAKQEN